MGGRGSSGGATGKKRSMSALSGSEKQVKWANEIRDTVNSVFDGMENATKNEPRLSEQQRSAALKSIEEYRQRVNSADDARDIIDLFKDVRKTSNPIEDGNRLMSAFRIKHSVTKGQRKILGR